MLQSPSPRTRHDPVCYCEDERCSLFRVGLLWYVILACRCGTRVRGLLHIARAHTAPPSWKGKSESRRSVWARFHNTQLDGHQSF